MNRDFRLIGLATIGLFLLVGVTASWYRGVWLDEAWSLYGGQHDLPFRRALPERWMVDLSGPYFYMLVWLFEPLTGSDIFGRRLLNLVPLGVAILALLLTARRIPGQSAFVSLYGVLLASHAHSIYFFAEHRSYFWILAGASILASSFWAIIARKRDYEPGDRWLLLLAFLGMLLSYSFQYVAALTTGVVVAIFIAAQWLLGLRRWAIRMLLASFVAGIPISACFLLQRSILVSYGGRGWIQTSTLTALALLGILLVLSLAVSTAAIMAGRSRIRENPQEWRQSPDRSFLTISSIAVCSSALVLIMANAIQPMVVSRYLIAYVPFIIAPIAACAAPAFATSRVYFWLIAGFAVFWLALTGIVVGRDERWFSTAGLISSVIRQCDETIVHALPRWRLRKGLVVAPSETRAILLGHEQAAKRFGFHFEPPSSQRMSLRCPTIIWVEHWQGASAVAVVQAAGLPATAAQLSASINREGATGFITVIPPNEGQ